MKSRNRINLLMRKRLTIIVRHSGHLAQDKQNGANRSCLHEIVRRGHLVSDPCEPRFLVEEWCKSSLPVAWVAPKLPAGIPGNKPRTNRSFSRPDQSVL